MLQLKATAGWGQKEMEEPPGLRIGLESGRKLQGCPREDSLSLPPKPTTMMKSSYWGKGRESDETTEDSDHKEVLAPDPEQKRK